MKSRFCPSPTGYVHLGNMRTALFNALLADSVPDGQFLLRIEDTDPERSKDEYVTAVEEDLQWLGLPWDEGPYFQSKRQAIYDQYYAQLESIGRAYPCFCSDRELLLTRKFQQAAGKPPRYTGTCRKLTQEQRDEKIAEGIQPTLRFHVEDSEFIHFEDLVRGKQRFNGVDIGDFVIRRANGTSPFMFCNAIDDALMGVTHALRGEDHLTNTPRQVLILQALQLRVPSYGHISLIVGPDGSPLSKRHGSRSIRELRESGFLPIAIVNYLARLGHYYADESFMTIAELSAQFKVENLGRSPARYDEKQLERWQHEAISRLSVEQLRAWIGEEHLIDVPEEMRNEFCKAIQPNIQYPKDAAPWAQSFFTSELNYDDDQIGIIKTAGKAFFQEAAQHGTDYAAMTTALKNNCGAKGKGLFQPLRVALTGDLHGPELEKILHVMGVERAKARLEKASSLAEA
jgi:glutamyl-tRNA synthetase